ncbi:STM4504/CBY_0614 family protein [Agrobacterium sp. CG674]
MGTFDTFWQRQRTLRGDVPDVYIYNDLPRELRVQVITIATEILGSRDEFMSDFEPGQNVRRAYEMIVNTLRKEFGVFSLPPTDNRGYEDKQKELFDFILFEKDVEKTLSAVELICRLIENMVSKTGYRHDRSAEDKAKGAISEINTRMKAAGLGYEYDGEIIRIDTELVHAEAVKPALELLREKRYQGPEQEFRTAYEHYRRGKNKEAVTEAAKAFESTMKVILAKREWDHNPSDPASKLIAALYDHQLIPVYWQNAMAGLRTLLESAVPTPRNKNSAHGQGVELTTVPDHIAGYVLHMTASTIVFLVKAEQSIP